MMKMITLTDRPETYFARYRFPELRFETSSAPSKELQPIWESLRSGNHAQALELATDILKHQEHLSNEYLAAVRVAQAAAEMQTGDLNRARRHAGKALDLYPDQYAANRILLSILALRKGFAAAYHHLLNLKLPKSPSNWDESISYCDIQIALAAWSWQMGEWDHAAGHIMHAYPKGVSEMPPAIREEWFRLSLYRGHPEDAAAAAALIIEREPVEMADELLQTIVQSGWTKEALPLYRDAYAKEPKSELLRRRLVALCIREGELDEARALATSGALRLAA